MGRISEATGGSPVSMPDAGRQMMPEAYEHGGKLAGVVTTLGFVIAFVIHLLD